MDSTQPGNANERTIIPIVCRFVPTDQWLLTHIDTAWKIQQLKLFLLAKFFPSSFISVPYLPRVQSSSKRRPVSPIRFASKPQPSPLTGAQLSDGEHGYEEDEEDFGDDLFSQYKWSANTRRSTSVMPTIAKPEQQASEDRPSGNMDPSQYTLLSFSSGQILEDQFSFDWFKLNPHELLELYSAGTLVSLTKSLPDLYILPYFEARVWALRAISRDIDDVDGGGRKGDSMESSPYGSDDRGVDPHAGRREKLAKKRRTRLEWRVRWVIVHEGVFKLCKSRNDDNPTHISPLSSLVAIRGAEHLSVGMTSSLPASTSSHGASRKDSKDIKNILSAKFRSEKTPRHLKLKPSSADITTAEMRTASGAWWRRGSKDAQGGHEKLKGTTQDSDTGHDGSVDEREGPEPRYTDDGSVWIVLDMRDSDTFQHILRLLHLHAPPTVYSSFFPTPSYSTEIQKSTTPAHRHPSLDGNLDRPPSPISFASRPPSIVLPSSPSSSQSLVSSLDASSASQSRTPPLMISTDTVGAKYPDWRQRIFARAQRAGMGLKGTSISRHVFGDSTSDGEAESTRSRHTTRRRTRPISAIPEHDAPQYPVEEAPLMDGVDSDTEVLYGTDVLDDDDSESSLSIQEDGTSSEMEWEGWAQDVQRRREAAFAKVKEDREKNAIRWDSNWVWDSQEGSSGTTYEELSISPRTDQSNFALSIRTSDSPFLSNKSNSRSVTSYASADSLLRRTIKRNSSKRETGAATVVGSTVRTIPPSQTESLQDGRNARSRTSLSAGFDDDEAEDVVGHEPKYTYASPHRYPQVQPSSSRQKYAEAHDTDAPFFSYYGSSQRLPLPRSMEMTTISSVVSVGGREDAQSKKKKKESQKPRGGRKSVLTAYSPLAHAQASFARSEHAESSKSASKDTLRGTEGHGEGRNSHSFTHRDPSLQRIAKPRLSMNTEQVSSGNASRMASATSIRGADWESPRFANPEESE